MFHGTSSLWNSMIGGSISVIASASVIRGGDVVMDNLPIQDGKITKSTDGRQIQQSLDLTVADETGQLQAGPLSPLMPFGQQIIVRAGLADKPVNPAISEMVPMGTFGIDKPTPQNSVPWKLYPNGKWVPSGGLVSIDASDPLAQIAREDFVKPERPAISATVRSESVRLLTGRLPVADDWTAGVNDAATVSRSVTYDSSRLTTLLNLAEIAGGVPWVNRNGAYQLLRQERQEVGVWRLSVATDITEGALVSWVPDMDREKFHNAVIILSEDTYGNQLRGVRYEESGPLAWGGPFGEVPLTVDNRLATSNAKAQALADEQFRREIDGRSITVSVKCLPNFALDPLDTIELAVPGQIIPGLITSIVYPLSGDVMELSVSIPFSSWMVLI